ncbi:MAG: energy transducer TonB [Acidobacteria bacterium]|nr:energy transducer TonB [Acidobacteriota bacterium]
MERREDESMKTTRIVKQLLAAFFLCAFASAQTPTGESKRYAQDGLSFDYPAGWALTDKSNQQAQHLVLTRAGGSALVMVVAHREPIMNSGQLTAGRTNITKPYAEKLARDLGAKGETDWQDVLCLTMGEKFATGYKLSGQFNGQPATGEVYAIMLGRRFIHVVYVRPDLEDAQAAAAWKSVLDSLRVEEPANAPPLAEEIKDLAMGGVLPGKAFKKPQPEYPEIARAGRASGVVSVKIVVDENGDVVSAQAVSGHPLLRESGERAARNAKFSPTKLCGKPVKVSGVITYNFVLQ